MTGLEFIAVMVAILAWPVAVLTIALVVKRELDR